MTDKKKFNKKARNNPAANLPEERADAFMDVVEAGDRKAMLAMLAETPDLARAVQKKTRQNRRVDHTALHVAAQKGFLDIAQDLVTAGAKVDATDWVKQTPLIVAAAEGRADMVVFFLQNKARPNHRASDKSTALMGAAQFECMPCIEALLQYGADINAVMEDGDTALHSAVFAERDPAGMIKFLIEKGAEAGIKNEAEQTAADVARLRARDLPHLSALAELLDEYPEQYATATKARQIRDAFTAEVNGAFHKGTEKIVAAPKRPRFTPKNSL